MSNHRMAVTGVTAVACCFCHLTQAQESGPLDTVMVTATRYPTPVKQVLAPTFVISRDDLARSLAPDVSDMLRYHAGVDVARSGGIGQPVSIFIRGAESNHTLVLIDGVRVNPGTVGNAPLQNIPPEMIERVEVVKGPRSTLYGSDAIGGVINIITRKRTSQGLQAEAQAGGGSYDTYQGSASVLFGGERFDAGVNGSWIDSDGFPTLTTDSTDRGFENRSFGAQASMELGAVDAGLRFWQSEGTSQYSDFFATPVDQDFRNRVATVDAGASPTDSWRTQLTLSRMEDDLLQNQSEDRVETTRDTADWQNNIALGENHRITAGAMYSTENADVLSYGSGFDVDTDIVNAYLQDQMSLGSHALLLAGGFTDHESFGGHGTWNAEYGFALTDRTQLIASAGTAFRAPDATDRFGFGGNPDLEPEESQNIELSFRHRFDQRQQLRISAFQNEIDQLITFDSSIFQLRNIDRARIRGVEASYQFSAQQWRFQTEATYQEPEDRATGNTLLRRATKSLSMSYVRALGPVQLGVDMLAVGEREDFGTELDSYVLAGLTARYELSDSLSLLARIDNLFNEQYELASGYNTPDRSWFMAMKYSMR